MDLYRVGTKLIDRKKIITVVDRILQLRARGLSQQQVAERLQLERPFISRLEKLGQIRKGKSVAVVAFPVANKKELQTELKRIGVDYTLIMTERERNEFVGEKNGAELLNTIMDIIAKIRTYDTVVVLGSNYRIKLSEALLDKEVIGIEIGKSPIEKDVHIDVEKIKELVKKLISNGG